MIANPSSLGNSDFHCSLFPWADRHTDGLGRVFRADIFENEFDCVVVAHELTMVNQLAATPIVSGYEDALLDYLVIKNQSDTESVIVELQLEDYLLATSTITIPPGQFMMMPRVNCTVFYPTCQTITVGSTAELEIFIFASNRAENWRGDYLYWMPGEMTWLKCSTFAPPDRAWMEPREIQWPYNPQAGDTVAGVNTFLPASLRVKKPLILHLGFLQHGSPTVAANAQLFMLVTAYDEATGQLRQIYSQILDIPFVGVPFGPELSHVDIDLGPFIEPTYSSLGFLFIRNNPLLTPDDELETDLGMYHGRTLL